MAEASRSGRPRGGNVRGHRDARFDRTLSGLTAPPAGPATGGPGQPDIAPSIQQAAPVAPRVPPAGLRTEPAPRVEETEPRETPAARTIAQGARAAASPGYAHQEPPGLAAGGSRRQAPGLRPPEPRRYRARPAGTRRRRKGPQNLHLSLPGEVAAELRRRGDAPGRSQPKVLFDALLKTRSAMPEILEARHAVLSPKVTDDLFIYPGQTTPAVAGAIDITMRVRAENLDAIDWLAEQAGAWNRNEYVSVALAEAFFGTGREVDLPLADDQPNPG